MGELSHFAAGHLSMIQAAHPRPLRSSPLPRDCPQPGTPRSAGGEHGHQEREAHEGEQGLSGHPSSNTHGSSIWAVASGSGANEGAGITRFPPPTACPALHLPQAAGGEAELTPLFQHARAQGVPRSLLFVFNTEGNFGGLLIAILYFIKEGEQERFEGHLQIEIAESLIAADIRDHLVL